MGFANKNGKGIASSDSESVKKEVSDPSDYERQLVEENKPVITETFKNGVST